MTENNDTGSRAVSSKWSGLPFIIGIAIFILSVGAAYSVTNSIDKNNRDNLLTRVQTIAYLTDGDAIASLTGTPADLGTPAYDSLKASLLKLHEINGDTRFVYFMRSNGAKLFFLADSEKTESLDYSPPGQVYENTTPLEFSNYNNRTSFTEGPYKDDWGTWVSAYAPVIAEDGLYPGIIGMDVNARSWQNEIRSVGLAIVAIGLIVAILFVLLGMYLRRSFVVVELSERMNSFLLREKKHADTIVARAGLGEWTLMPITGTVSFNDTMYVLTGIEKNAALSLESLMASLQYESKKTFEKTYGEACEKIAHDFTCTVITLPGKKLHISATIEYGSELLPVRVTGIAQELA